MNAFGPSNSVRKAFLQLSRFLKSQKAFQMLLLTKQISIMKFDEILFKKGSTVSQVELKDCLQSNLQTQMSQLGMADDILLDN